MPEIIDPLTKTEDLLIQLLNTDPALAAYGWQRWESDEPLSQPRGYVNVGASADLIAPDAPQTLRCEVVLEGKPARGSQADMVAIMIGILADPVLHTRLNDLVNDGSMLFYAAAERLQITQAIERDIRVRRAVFQIAALWQVAYDYSTGALAPSTATVTSLVPDTTKRNVSNLAVQVNGTGFVTGAQVLYRPTGASYWNVIAAGYISPTKLVTESFDPTTQGDYDVAVQKPGELPSNSQTFHVQ